MPSEPTQPSDVDRAIAFVKRSRSRYVTRNEILDMIIVNATLHQDDATASTRTATLLSRRKPQLVQQVWKEFVEKGSTMTKPQPPPRDMSLRTRLPITSNLATIMQDIVRQWREGRYRTVAKDVAHFLRSQNLLAFDIESQSSMQAAYRSTQRVLAKLGYKMGQKKRGLSLRVCEANINIVICMFRIC
ncbi:hypothetical protein DYB31_014395, partial [Aphanomyces astaci]